ncbi:ribonuclease III [Candidatus Saccharibacteria bacterium]|nr:ribonuclease III [Candidatus Saccharibacteria bacterium]
MDTTPYQEFAKEKLGFSFNDIGLLVTALTHRSYMNEHQKTAREHNERLEYLGDAVLELVTSDFLYRNYDYPEGVMTALRAALVRTESIGEAGKELGYEPLVRLSKGEQKGTERAHESILADCFEAVIGAIYLDQGYEVAREFIAKHILTKIDTVLKEESWRDPKSYMQELAQKNDGFTPTYRTLKEEGPDHNKTFTVGVYVDGNLRGTGVGHSKQEAQTEAAREGIRKYREDNMS